MQPVRVKATVGTHSGMVMLIVLSPSKTLDLDSPFLDYSYTTPRLVKQSEELVDVLRNYSSEQLSQLMEISDKLSLLNFSRFQNFSTPFNRNNSRPSLFCFKGDVYNPMDVSNYSKKDVDYAQGHVRILSGLYGVLKAMDLMQPYRLEMGTKLKTDSGKDLYQLWGDCITQLLNEDLAAQKEQVLVNLASEEYFHVVKPENIKGRVVHIVFKEQHKGSLKIIGIHAKKARGMMTDFAIKEKFGDVKDLTQFNCGGYSYRAELSSENNFVFVR